jgi:flavodoxin I
MGKAIVVYASETGNTESVAEEVVKGLEQGGLDVTLKNVEESSPGELSEYDLVLLASSSWGEEEKELHESMVDFYEELKGIDLSGKSAAAFGCGDSEYMYFCGAVDLLEERLEERGAKLLHNLGDGFRVDGDPDQEISESAETWGKNMAENFQKIASS